MALVPFIESRFVNEVCFELQKLIFFLKHIKKVYRRACYLKKTLFLSNYCIFRKVNQFKIIRTMYKVDWTKYKNISFDKALILSKELKIQYHNCPFLLEKKKKLEKVVKQSRNIQLKDYFKTTRYSLRKRPFYQRIIDDFFQGENMEMTELEKTLCELVKDILYTYSEKKGEMEYLEDLINDIAARHDHQEEMRESFMEDWRGCD